MIFETIGIGILKAREWLKYLIQKTSDYTRVHFVFLVLSAILITLFLLMISGWVSDYSITYQITNSIIYFLCVLLYGTVLYFERNRKQIIKVNNEFKVISSPTLEQEPFQSLPLKAITSSHENIEKLYQFFSRKHLSGDLDSFQKLILLDFIDSQNKLTWIDTIPKNPNQINRQTLLEFLSQIFSGFENLDNQCIRRFVASFFQDHNGNELKISSKNVSDWRSNQSPYLKEISRFIHQTTKG